MTVDDIHMFIPAMLGMYVNFYNVKGYSVTESTVNFFILVIYTRIRKRANSI